MTSLERIKADFERIKKLSFVEDQRTNNRDGGIGNTYEDLLGIAENNLTSADYLGYEIKSKRQFNSSYLSLFCKTPSYPKGVNSYLRETYGEIRDINHPEMKKLYASVFGHRNAEIYGRYNMKLEIDYQTEKLFLQIKNLKNQLFDSVYWTFEDLQLASSKLKSLMLVLAEKKQKDKKRCYLYNKAEIYHNFSFERFLKCIEKGDIMFDIRIGIHNSGKYKGKTHDHGSGFRIKRESLKNIYETFQELE